MDTEHYTVSSGDTMLDASDGLYNFTGPFQVTKSSEDPSSYLVPMSTVRAVGFDRAIEFAELFNHVMREHECRSIAFPDHKNPDNAVIIRNREALKTQEGALALQAFLIECATRHAQRHETRETGTIAFNARDIVPSREEPPNSHVVLSALNHATGTKWTSYQYPERPRFFRSEPLKHPDSAKKSLIDEISSHIRDGGTFIFVFVDKEQRLHIAADSLPRTVTEHLETDAASQALATHFEPLRRGRGYNC